MLCCIFMKYNFFNILLPVIMFQKMLQYVLLMFALFAFPFLWYAQNDACWNLALFIDGPSEVKKESQTFYETYINEEWILESLAVDNDLSNASVLYRVFYEWKLIKTSSEKKFFYEFANIGIYEISATVSIKNCTLVDTITIRTFDDIFFYFGSFITDFNKGIQQNIQQQEILFSSFIVDGGIDNVLDETILQDLEKKLTDIRHSQVFYFNLENFSHVFTLLDWLENEKNIDFSSKKVVLISSTDPTLLKKFLAPFIKDRSYSLYIATIGNLRDVFYSLSVWDTQSVYNVYSSSIQFVGDELSYSLSRFVDILIYYGFPMDVVSMLLVLSLCICILVFLRQIIGVSVFGLYFPMLMAISFVMIGEPTTLLFFGLSFVSYYAAKFLHAKINMLVYAKIGSYLILYIFFTLLLLGIATLITSYQWNLGWVSDIVVVISYLLMPLIGKKVFAWKKWLLTMNFWSSLIWFVALAYMMSWMLMAETLQHWLLIRPEIIVAFFFFVILFGKFTGLQVSEYIRFWPVIKKEIFSKKPKKIGAKSSK